MNINVESLYCISEVNIPLFVKYTSIKKELKNFKGCNNKMQCVDSQY